MRSQLVKVAVLPRRGMRHDIADDQQRGAFTDLRHQIEVNRLVIRDMPGGVLVVDADVNVHNTSEVLFRLCANTDPQRDSIFTKGPSDVLDHATSEIAIGSKLGIDATKKLPGEGFKRPWPPLIKMDESVKAKVEKMFGNWG